VEEKGEGWGSQTGENTQEGVRKSDFGYAFPKRERRKREKDCEHLKLLGGKVTGGPTSQ